MTLYIILSITFILFIASTLLQVPDLEAPFALLWIRHRQPEPFNHGAFGLKLRQLVCGPMQFALVSNFHLDVSLLDAICPALRTVPRVVLVHGLKNEMIRMAVQGLAPAWNGEVRRPLAL